MEANSVSSCGFGRNFLLLGEGRKERFSCEHAYIHAYIHTVSAFSVGVISTSYSATSFPVPCDAEKLAVYPNRLSSINNTWTWKYVCYVLHVWHSLLMWSCLIKYNKTVSYCTSYLADFSKLHWTRWAEFIQNLKISVRPQSDSKWDKRAKFYAVGLPDAVNYAVNIVIPSSVIP